MNSILIFLIAATVIVSAKAFQDRSLFYKLMFNAYQAVHRKEYFRLLSHGLVHGDWMHLLVNMFVLFSFGRNLVTYFEHYLGINGSIGLLVFYLLALPVSSLFSLLKEKENPMYNAVGASGAVSAVVFACIFFDPWNLLYFFGVIPIPGIVFGIGYLYYSYRMGKQNNDNIGHDAHFWGALFGFSFPIIVKPSSIFIFLDQLITLPF